MRRWWALLSLGVAVTAVPSTALAGGLEWRGIVEGAYGQPWTHAERMRVFEWMPAHGFNAYVHAPKDDLYQRTNWRDAYPADQMRQFRREIALAAEIGIEWIPNLSPALPEIPTPALPTSPPSRDLCFSCPYDLDAVFRKLRPFLRAGARTVMISFDDVAKLSTHLRDLTTYGVGDRAFGEANGDFLTRLDARLSERYDGARLLTVGADYSGTGDTAYLRGLRSTLAPGIGVMWTGTGIPSQHWSAADARAYGRQIGRTPIVWDNWTNDDTAGNATPLGTARLFLGPYTRAPAAAGAVAGFFFNPMNEADLNLLPLATAGDWMVDPGGYDPEASWLAAIGELAPGADPAATRTRESFRAWSEASWSNKLDPADAPTFSSRAAAFLAAYKAGGRWPDASTILAHELRLVQLAPDRLPRLPDRAIARQAEAFLVNGRASARSGQLARQTLVAERPSLGFHATAEGFSGHAAPPDPASAVALAARTAVAAASARADSEFTYGWRTPLAFEIPPYAVPRNVLDSFVDRALVISAAWLPSAPAASNAVVVTINGHTVALNARGRSHLPPSACAGRLVATDGAGGRTTRLLPPCGP